MNSSTIDNRSYASNEKALLRLAEEIKALRQTIAPLVAILINSEVKKQVNDSDTSKQVNTDYIKKFIEDGSLVARIGNLMLRSGFKTLRDFDYVTLKDIANIRNMGKKGLELLNQFLSKNNIVIESQCKPIPDYKENDIVRNVLDSKTYRIDTIYLGTNGRRIFTLPSYRCTQIGIFEDYSVNNIDVSTYHFFSPGEIELLL